MRIQRRRVWWLIAVVFVTAASYGRHTAGAQGGTVLHGRVRILMPGGASQQAQDAVVWLSGAAPEQPAQSSTRAKMVSEGKRFLPHVVVIQAGETVDFPNVDRIFHNAFSVSPGNQFDLGLYRKGAEARVNGAIGAAHELNDTRAYELARVTGADVAFLANFGARDGAPKVQR